MFLIIRCLIIRFHYQNSGKILTKYPSSPLYPHTRIPAFYTYWNLRIGKVKNYNNKILILSLSFKIGTNLKINLDGEKDKPDVKSNKEHKQGVKVIRTKPNVKKEHEQDIKMMKTEPDTHEEEKAALILVITSIFGSRLWLFK